MTRYSIENVDSAWAFPSQDYEPYAKSNTLQIECRDHQFLTCWCNSNDPNSFDKTLLYFHGSGELVSKIWLRSEIDGIPNFRDFLDVLLNEFRIRTILVEYRGFGINSSIGSPSLLQNMIDAEDILKSLNDDISKVIVMGRSVGSVSALYLVSKYPKISSLILDSCMADPCQVYATHLGLTKEEFINQSLNSLGFELSKLESVLNSSSVSSSISSSLSSSSSSSSLESNRKSDGSNGSFDGSLLLLHTIDDECLLLSDLETKISSWISTNTTSTSTTTKVNNDNINVNDNNNVAIQINGNDQQTPCRIIKNKNKVLVKFEGGGHNYIWPLNWKTYTEVMSEFLTNDSEIRNHMKNGKWWYERTKASQSTNNNQLQTCQIM